MPRMAEVVIYAENMSAEEIQKVIKNQKSIEQYAYILHDKDGGKHHYHVMMKFNNNREFEYIAKWFSITENFVSKIKGKYADAVAYLTHENAPDKHQYSRDEVVSNFDINVVIDNRKQNKDKKLDEIVNGILDGVITEWNIDEYITVQEETRWQKTIFIAFARRDKVILKGERKMKCLWITGESGTGKSTLAKQIAESKGYDIFRSSSSNDILDGYSGQQCIILDDFRGNNLSFSDLLKLADNHHPSSVKSRYKNKVLNCKLLIVTSIKLLSDCYINLAEQDEPMKQLRRRFQEVYRMTTETIKTFVYSSERDTHEFITQVPNAVLLQYKVEKMSDDEKYDIVADTLAGIGDIAKYMKENKPPF